MKLSKDIRKRKNFETSKTVCLKEQHPIHLKRNIFDNIFILPVNTDGLAAMLPTKAIALKFETTMERAVVNISLRNIIRNEKIPRTKVGGGEVPKVNGLKRLQNGYLQAQKQV